MKRPYISIVVVGRNDNYGGDFKKRLQNFITWNHEQLLTNGISAEIVFVNYNPLKSEAAIQDFINWPSSTDIVPIRVITVPNSVHQQIIADGKRKDVPVMEYLAKNVGVRSAKGEFILCMNPDIILPRKLVKGLKTLKKDTYYRADRVDFSGDMNTKYELTRVFLKGQSYPIKLLAQLPKLRRNNFFLNKWRAFTPKIQWLLNRISVPVYYDNVENQVHCNVSGDFMLMHRNYWFSIRGHMEQTPIALHVDALTVVQAAALGLKEHVFDSPIFHQEHERRYDATEENPEFLKAFQFFSSEAKGMLKSRASKRYNDEHWGLSKFELPETKI